MTTTIGVEWALAWLATYGLHSTLFLGGAWLATRQGWPRSERNRERTWKLALVGGVLSSALQVGSGARPLLGNFSWSESRPEEIALAAGAASPDVMPLPGPKARPAERSAAEVAEPRPLRRAPSSRPIPTGPATAARVPRPSPAGVRGATLPTPRVPGTELLVLSAWSGIVSLGLVLVLGSWIALRRRLLGREFLRAGPLVARLEDLRQRAAIPWKVRLSVSARTRTPFSAGWFRPEICVPAAALVDLTPAQQEAMLAHELAHLVRRDPAWFALGLLVERLFFFQPLNRLARRELAELAETACDDWAVRWTGARLALASLLTEVAGWVLGEERRPVTAPGLAGARSRLGKRIERLLDDRRSPCGEIRARWWPPLVGGTLALATLAVPGVSSTPRGAAGAPPKATRPELAPPVGAAPQRAQLSGSLPERGAPDPSAALEPAQLASDLEALEEELGLLRAELGLRDLPVHFADALDRIEERLEALRARDRRLQELLAFVRARSTPKNPAAEALLPAAPSPAPTADPSDPHRDHR